MSSGVLNTSLVAAKGAVQSAGPKRKQHMFTFAVEFKRGRSASSFLGIFEGCLLEYRPVYVDRQRVEGWCVILIWGDEIWTCVS